MLARNSWNNIDFDLAWQQKSEIISCPLIHPEACSLEYQKIGIAASLTQNAQLRAALHACSARNVIDAQALLGGDGLCP